MTNTKTREVTIHVGKVRTGYRAVIRGEDGSTFACFTPPVKKTRRKATDAAVAQAHSKGWIVISAEWCKP